MARRTREFDRSAFFGDVLYALGPDNQVHMPTGDVWRAHRRLMGDTMSPAFLGDVSALYDSHPEIAADGTLPV